MKAKQQNGTAQVVEMTDEQQAEVIKFADALKKAEQSALTAGQRGAWAVACFVIGGKTLEEAVAAIRAYLKAEGMNGNAIERSRPLFPQALEFRRESPKYPTKGWMKIATAKAVASRSGKSVTDLCIPNAWPAACEFAFEAARNEVVEGMAARGVDGEPSAESVETRVRTGAPKATREGNAEGGTVTDKVAPLVAQATLAELTVIRAMCDARELAIKAARNAVA